MKKITINLLLILLAGMAIVACRKVEAEPKGFNLEEAIFDTTDSTGSISGFFLNNLYNYIPSGFNRVNGDFLDAGTDDALPSRTNIIPSVEFFTNGQVNVLNNPDAYWSNSYNGIRQANVFLKNYQKTPLRKNLLHFDTLWPAEARFIRALLYFELLKRYGGVPLVGDSVYNFTDNLEFPRNTFEECVNYIVSECDSIKNKLHKEQVTDQFWGRATRGAAIALKARTLLYAASPLMNGGGVEREESLRRLTGYLNYDQSRWQKASDAAKELMDLGAYSLQTAGATVQAKYVALFNSRRISTGANEIIFAKQSAQNQDLERWNAPIGPFSATITGNEGRTSPTQNFVDAFPTLAGDSITKSGSGYSDQAPYANRDPRLAVFVFTDSTAARWLGRPIRTFEGGTDKPNDPVNWPVQTRTGYYLRKFLGEFSTGSAYTNQNHNFILFRYAEILLNYAEAQNELGNVEEAAKQIIALRARASLTAGANGRYGVPSGATQEQMRRIIYNERRIELSFEEHRFYDVRRWKIAPQVLSGPVRGMQITKSASTNAKTYTTVNVSTMVWNNKLYHNPIPYNEVVKNRNMKQNEGW